MTFSVLGITGYGYGLGLAISILLYLGVSGVLGYRRRLPAGTLRVFALVALPVSLVLARVAFCLVNWAYFTETISQPARMLAFWDGGLSLIGALSGLVLAAFLAARLMRVRFAVLFDVVAVPIGLLVAGFRLAEGFTGQLGIGRQVALDALAQQLPILFLTEQMGTMTFYRLAVYRYEAAVGLVIFLFALWLFARQGKARKSRQGDVGMMVFALLGASQILLESLRDDGHMLMGFIRLQQLGFALMPLLALAVLSARYGRIRMIRGTVVAAWLLLPVMALVGLLMVHPLNHVLDLTGKRALGWALMGALGLYMALFLRVRGGSLRLILTWLAALLAIGGCVMVEFSIDGSDNLLRDYAIMAMCCTALYLAVWTLWHTLRRRIYREERLTVRIQSAG